MDIARDIIARTGELSADRALFERDWVEIADYFEPSLSSSMRMGATAGGGTMAAIMQGPSIREGSRKRFDSTPIACLDRLAAGIESLVSPQNEKWQELGPLDPLSPDPTDEENQWYERLRDYQFAVRYTPLSGFANVNQKYIRSICGFGTGVIFTEEAFGKREMTQRQLPAVYAFVPVSEALIGVDMQGNPDTVHRRFSRSARQCYQKFGDKCSAKLKERANDSTRCDEQIELIHAVFPRTEYGSRGSGMVRKAPWVSFYIEVEGAHLIGESGYFEFPYGIGYWRQGSNSAYGESPCLAALDDARGLNVTRKSVLTMWQTAARPPMAVAHDGVMNRPNMNPAAINHGAIDSNGRLKIQPIIAAPNPSIGKDVVEDHRNTVKELTYNNLFQILVQNPQMTAHEAMLRASEKGDLLGPNGVKIQQGYSSVSDREIGIFERKGAFREGAPLEPPKSLRGRSFGARFTSTLDRMRESKGASGIMQAYQAAGQIASLRGDPQILDNFDDDINLKELARIWGMPLKGLKTTDVVLSIRKTRAQAMQAQMAAGLGQQAAGVAKDVAQGEKHAAEANATQQQSGGGGSAGIDAIQKLLAAAQKQGALPNGGSLGTAPLPLPQLVPDQAGA